jgi:cytochrome c5
VSHQDRVFFSTFVGVLAGLVVLAVIFFVIASYVTSGEEGGSLPVDQKAVAERIKPVGEVTVGSAAPAAGAAARSGETIVKTVCSACHGSGAMGAPKIGDKAAWAPRIAQGEKVLVQHATHGIRAMPPKGTCADCSDAELKGAVEYLMSQAK